MKNLSIRNLKSEIENWLPDIDLNYDKQIQSLLCYRYTIGQSVAFKSLNALSSQSSRRCSDLSLVTRHLSLS